MEIKKIIFASLFPLLLITGCSGFVVSYDPLIKQTPIELLPEEAFFVSSKSNESTGPLGNMELVEHIGNGRYQLKLEGAVFYLKFFEFKSPSYILEVETRDDDNAYFYYVLIKKTGRTVKFYNPDVSDIVLARGMKMESIYSSEGSNVGFLFSQESQLKGVLNDVLTNQMLLEDEIYYIFDADSIKEREQAEKLNDEIVLSRKEKNDTASFAPKLSSSCNQSINVGAGLVASRRDSKASVNLFNNGEQNITDRLTISFTNEDMFLSLRWSKNVYSAEFHHGKTIEKKVEPELLTAYMGLKMPNKHSEKTAFNEFMRLTESGSIFTIKIDGREYKYPRNSANPLMTWAFGNASSTGIGIRLDELRAEDGKTLSQWLVDSVISMDNVTASVTTDFRRNRIGEISTGKEYLMRVDGESFRNSYRLLEHLENNMVNCK